jgi:hypothetical protein
VAGHFLSTELRLARLDGSAPAEAGVVELDEYTHDMALDPYAGHLFVAQDVGKQVTVLQLYPPVDGAAVPEPVFLGTIDMATAPRFLRVDPLRHRLFVVADLPPDEDLQGWMRLHVFDVSNPGAPTPLGTHDVPATVSLDLDPLAGILFLVSITVDKLYLFDIAAGGLDPVAGDPIDLRADYPQENNTGFQARNLVVDPWRGRVLAARSQGALSEVIAYQYTPAVPAAPGDCPPRPDHTSLQPMADGFDVDVPVEERPNLLDAYSVLPNLLTGSTLLVADAWNGTSSTALAVSLDGDLEASAGCGDYEGFGCWLQYTSDGTPGTHLRTDGAACLDSGRGVLVSTSISSWGEEDPGGFHFYKIQPDLQMAPWLPADGDTMTAGVLPVAAVCY